MEERLLLAIDRIKEINNTQQMGMMEYQPYFKSVSKFLLDIIEIYYDIENKKDITLKELRLRNELMFKELYSENYANSYLNPDVAAKLIGNEKMAILLSAVFAELRSIIGFAFDGEKESLLIRLELFLEIYGSFECAYNEDGKEPLYEAIYDIFYYFVFDYSDIETDRRIRERMADTDNLIKNVIMNADLSNEAYLYKFGEYVSENDILTAKYVNELSEETIEKMAAACYDGFVTGFKLAGKDLSKKKYVNIRCRLGFERVVRKLVKRFEAIDIQAIIYRAANDIYSRSGAEKVGFYGSLPNPQYDEDHKEDMALLLDGHMTTRRLECLKASYEVFKECAASFAGPACIETFGEKPFSPVKCEAAIRYGNNKMYIEYLTQSSMITNEYIDRKERSFTIIAFPTAAIGDSFEEIFDEVIKINTLDVDLYRSIQQTIINTLDKGDYVHIVGRNGNKTELTVKLIKLNDSDKETKFENCVADVNIPAGEVFTSPKLKGTNGILHNKKVFLNECEYSDLTIRFEDGIITEYDCSRGKEIIEENLLFHHKTLPMGEFAIGTNTYAYRMANKYDINDRLPILIAEKTGPHFAIGDTCYSNEEEVRVYNPDGKEIVAKENDYSLLRNNDRKAAYFNCHTDITIPYDELKLIEVVDYNGNKTAIIQDGQFCLKGCEELNKALC